MIEMYLADDMNDGGKTVFLINNDTMYVVDYNKEIYLFLMEKQTTDFITDAGLNSVVCFSIRKR